MDSQWINLRVNAGVNKYDQQNNAANDNLDLTLKLGLPNSDNDQNQEQRLDVVPNIAPHGQADHNVHGQNFTQGMNTHYEMGNEARLVSGNNNGGQAFHSNANNPLYVRPPSWMQPNHVQGSAGQFSSYSPPIPVYTNLYHPYTHFMMNPNHYIMMPRPSPSHTMNDYTLIDHIPRRIGHEFGGGSLSLCAGGSRRISGMRSQRRDMDPYKRCTNYNCNTNDTPMWRNGPLGPKTLCNACGIKYRKEEEKRKANEAGSSSRSGGQESNT